MGEMGMMGGGDSGGGGGKFDAFTNLGDKIHKNVLSTIDTFVTLNEKKKLVPRQARQLDAQSRILELQAKDLEDKQSWNRDFRKYMLGGR